MDAFENLVAMLLRREGYWTATCFKVNLTKPEKRKIGRHSSPRWEIDVIAYKGSTNELIAVECKSFLDSVGVKFRSGALEPDRRYKLFNDKVLRSTVLRRVKRQLVETGACRPNPKITLALAIGKLASVTDRDGLVAHFAKHGWRLFEPRWIAESLKLTASTGYENDTAFLVAKIVSRNLSVFTEESRLAKRGKRGSRAKYERVLSKVRSRAAVSGDGLRKR